ncbi:efflux transporter outer membrane subunit [Kiritimatiella glycovorans]|uniref:Toluene efflux pump outer membrane protein TtgI n=1 Tax=Kiritimatiella glycovorans TaxID=1307763 RepID=A0A0G3ECG3_9BACT|nr:efflux transporter outer membrane subunit [Kiritimatiella glycovorans]AKJ63988.1 Toluene efflux pump outer membrane protein TtgI precursor [Kiritimatiella glycovorans]
MIRIPVSALILVLFSAGCVLNRPEIPDEPAPALPERYAEGHAVRHAPDRWWTAFDSPELDRLIARTLEGNYDLEQALARIDQARALARRSRSGLFPSLDVESAASVSRTRVDDGRTVARDSNNAYGLDLVSLWELDLWGRVRAQTRARELDRDAAVEAGHDLALSLTAETAVRWLNLIHHNRRIERVRAQIEANRQSLELLEHRFGQGTGTALDVLQQRELLAATRALLPPLESRRDTLRHELAVLLGRAPGTAEIEISTPSLPEPGPVPDAGIPCTLLDRRPDIRQARYRLEAAGWDVGAARADRLPRISLTAAQRYGDPNGLDLLLDNWSQSLAAGLTAPLFDAGRRRAEVERARAAAREALAAYRSTVLTAVREVSDALVRETNQSETVHRLSTQLEQSRATLEESRFRYRKGQADYLTVLSALTRTQELERRLIRARFERLSFRIELYRALGGDWMKTATLGRNRS